MLAGRKENLNDGLHPTYDAEEVESSHQRSFIDHVFTGGFFGGICAELGRVD